MVYINNNDDEWIQKNTLSGETTNGPIVTFKLVGILIYVITIMGVVACEIGK